MTAAVQRSVAERLLDELDAYTPLELAAMTPAEFEWYEQQYDVAYAALAREREHEWRLWLPTLFPHLFAYSFAPHHGELWDWVWAIELGVKPADAFIAVWSRGGAKSTSAEAAVAALGARRRRKYALYVCDTQQQADTHVEAIGSLLESRRIELAYPELGQRLVGKYGSSRGWRRNRLRTASGLTVDALGLDSAARGLKIDEDRPDLIVFDDIDSEDDGLAVIERKVDDLTAKLLPAGGESLAVLGIQNIPNPAGIFARLSGIADEPADFLHHRHVSGPVPAVRDATYERDPSGGWQIVAGEATWDGQSIARCNAQIAEWGITAFRIEAQHEVDARGGGMFDHVEFTHCARADVPDLVRTAVWVDPAVTATDSSDSMAVQLDGIAADGRLFRLRSWEQRATPVAALTLALAWALCEGATKVGVETDQGGDTWQSVYREAWTQLRADLERAAAGEPVDGPDMYVHAVVELCGRETLALEEPPLFAERKAGSTQQPKAHRAQQMLVDYERAGRIVHVLGTHLALERALRRFPRQKPFDLVDAAYWGWREFQTDPAHAQVARQPVPTRAAGARAGGRGLVAVGRYR